MLSVLRLLLRDGRLPPPFGMIQPSVSPGLSVAVLKSLPPQALEPLPNTSYLVAETDPTADGALTFLQYNGSSMSPPLHCKVQLSHPTAQLTRVAESWFASAGAGNHLLSISSSMASVVPPPIWLFADPTARQQPHSMAQKRWDRTMKACSLTCSSFSLVMTTALSSCRTNNEPTLSHDCVQSAQSGQNDCPLSRSQPAALWKMLPSLRPECHCRYLCLVPRARHRQRCQRLMRLQVRFYSRCVMKGVEDMAKGAFTGCERPPCPGACAHIPPSYIFMCPCKTWPPCPPAAEG